MSIPGSLLYGICICNGKFTIRLLPNHLFLRLVPCVTSQFMEAVIP